MRVLFAMLAFLAAAPVNAQCAGQNLLDAMPTQQREDLGRAAHSYDYATGNLWRAVRGSETLVVAGTFHLDDPRHATMMEAVRPLLLRADTLLVEAGPAEEDALRGEMTANPDTIMVAGGAGLEQALPPDEWQALTAALLARGVPSSLSIRLRPWFVSMMLAIPPCAMQLAAQGGGLDKRLIAAATEAGIPVRALEPYDTALKLFDGLTWNEQVTMIRGALAVEPEAADFMQTTADAYFSEESRLIWELNRAVAHKLPGASLAETDAGFAEMEDVMISARNRRWIPVIEEALKNGPAFAAFGALHLSGPQGVLKLLEQRGFTVTRLPV